MADEEGEIRRMAEIADAINAILEADQPQAAAAEEAPRQSPNDMTDAKASEANSPEADMAAVTAVDDVIAADDLDAAIAAEFAKDGDFAAGASDDPFGPVPALDLPGAPPVNNAVGQDVRPGSEMADLSMRMQDTLAEIRAQSSEAWIGAEDLLAEMEAARAAMVADIRGQIQSISDATQKRREVIMAELTELENQSMMARDEMEVMLVKFEASLGELQSRYFQNAELEKDRLARYREFLQFLLDERGL